MSNRQHRPGFLFIYAEGVRVYDKEYAGLYALSRMHGNFWMLHLAKILHEEIDRRAQSGRRLSGMRAMVDHGPGAQQRSDATAAGRGGRQ